MRIERRMLNFAANNQFDDQFRQFCILQIIVLLFAAAASSQPYQP